MVDCHNILNVFQLSAWRTCACMRPSQVDAASSMGTKQIGRPTKLDVQTFGECPTSFERPNIFDYQHIFLNIARKLSNAQNFNVQQVWTSNNVCPYGGLTQHYKRVHAAVSMANMRMHETIANRRGVAASSMVTKKVERPNKIGRPNILLDVQQVLNVQTFLTSKMF